MISRKLLTLATAAVLGLSLSVPQDAHAGAYDDILHAANLNETDKVVDLLRRGMDVNTTDAQGSTLLMIAVRGNNIELVRFLLANRVNALRKNNYGDTALMIAALQGNANIVQLMLEHKINPNHSGWNALHYAAYGGKEQIIALLLAAGADVNQKAPNGQSALMLASKLGHFSAVRMLVGAHADLSIQHPIEGSALDIARNAGHSDIATFLEKADSR